MRLLCLLMLWSLTLGMLQGCSHPDQTPPITPSPEAQAHRTQQKQFLASLQSLPAGERAQYLQANQALVSEIMQGSDPKLVQQLRRLMPQQ